MSGRLPVVFLLLLWTAPAGAEPDATVTVRLVEGADELAVVLTVPGGSGRPVTVDFGDSPFLEGPASWNRFVEDGGGRVPPWSHPGGPRRPQGTPSRPTYGTTPRKVPKKNELSFFLVFWFPARPKKERQTSFFLVSPTDHTPRFLWFPARPKK